MTAPTPLMPGVADPVAPASATHPGTHPTVAPSDATLTAGEFEALSGVRAERIRTWQRRFDFPELLEGPDGRRRFRPTDVPRVLAVSQLVDGGLPVNEAIELLRAGPERLGDYASLERAFAHVSTPVVALAGPSPVQVVWCNDAARAQAPRGCEVPHLVADRDGAWHGLLSQPPCDALRLTHRPWFEDAAERTPALVWAVGAPQFAPAILLVVDLPAEAPSGEQVSAASTPADRGERGSRAAESEPVPPAMPGTRPAMCSAQAEHQWAAAVGGARRALQRGTNAPAISEALGGLVRSGLIADALLLLMRPEEPMRLAMTARGRRQLAQLPPTAAAALNAVLLTDQLAPLEREASAGLGVPTDRTAVAAPLIAGGEQYGVLVLELAAGVSLPDEADVLLLGFAATLAAALSRDRAVMIRRRRQEADNAAADRGSAGRQPQRRGAGPV